jgi:hypothetical protein
MLRPAWCRLIAGPTGIELCAVIGQVEADFASHGEGEVMAALAVRARDLTRQALSLLGYQE